MRYYFIPNRMVIIKDEDMEKLEHLGPANGKIKWYIYFGKQLGSSSRS